MPVQYFVRKVSKQETTSDEPLFAVVSGHINMYPLLARQFGSLLEVEDEHVYCYFDTLPIRSLVIFLLQFEAALGLI